MAMQMEYWSSKESSKYYWKVSSLIRTSMYSETRPSNYEKKKKKSKFPSFHTFSMISYFMRMFDVFFSFWQKINIQRSSLLQLFVFHSYSNQILFLLTKFLSEKLISSVVIIPYRLNFLEEVKNVSKTSSIVYFLNWRRDGVDFCFCLTWQCPHHPPTPFTLWSLRVTSI